MPVSGTRQGGTDEGTPRPQVFFRKGPGNKSFLRDLRAFAWRWGEDSREAKSMGVFRRDFRAAA